MMNPIIEADGHVINLLHLVHADKGASITIKDNKEILKSITEESMWLIYDNGDRIEIKGQETIEKIIQECRMRGYML
jgi:hypothetical protein